MLYGHFAGNATTMHMKQSVLGICLYTCQNPLKSHQIDDCKVHRMK
jgi:hypothetical protein